MGLILWKTALYIFMITSYCSSLNKTMYSGLYLLIDKLFLYELEDLLQLGGLRGEEKLLPLFICLSLQATSLFASLVQLCVGELASERRQQDFFWQMRGILEGATSGWYQEQQPRRTGGQEARQQGEEQHRCLRPSSQSTISSHSGTYSSSSTAPHYRISVLDQMILSPLVSVSIVFWSRSRGPIIEKCV